MWLNVTETSRFSYSDDTGLRAKLLLRIEQIASAGGSEFPTIDELEYEFRASRMEIVKIIRELLREKYLVREGPSKFLISDPWGSDVRVRLRSVRDVASSAGVRLATIDQYRALRRPDADECIGHGFSFEQRIGACALVHTINDQPVIAAQWLFDMARFPGVVNIDRTSLDLLDYFRKLMPGRAIDSRVRAIACDAVTAGLLAIDEGAVCLEVVYIIRDDRNQLVHGCLRHNAAFYELPGRLSESLMMGEE